MSRVLLVIVITFMCVCSGTAKEKQTYAMSMKIFEVIESANQLMDESDHNAAIELLSDTLTKRASKYEKAQLHYLLGSFFYRLDDHGSALKQFERVLEFADGMPQILHRQALKTIIQMHLVQENYERARHFALIIVTIGEVRVADDFSLLAQANYKLEYWEEALEASLTALSLEHKAGRKPTENILLILNSIHYEMKSLDKMVGVLEVLIKHYPKTTYVMYLASIYGQLDRLDKQTVLMESLYESGKLTKSNELRNLASLYLSEKVPYKAAVLLAEEIRNGNIDNTSRNLEMLAQAWRLAAEELLAIHALGQAAQMSDTGQLYLRQAYLLFDKGNFKEAGTAVNKALDKGLEEKSQGEAWLLLGMSRYNLKKFSEALQACERALAFEQSNKLAQSWLTFISAEEAKYQFLLGE